MNEAPHPAPRLPRHLLASARVLPSRNDILPLLPKHKIFAEVGVALGDFSQSILTVCRPRRFIAIDTFVLHTKPDLWGTPTAGLFHGKTHEHTYRDRFREPIASGRMQVMPGTSHAMLEALEDRSVDIFYVDADHTYDVVCLDLEIIARKVRPDGYIIMNDYIMADAAGPYGVVQATNEFMIREGWKMTHLALHEWMYCDVVLRRARPRDKLHARAAEILEKLHV